MKFVPRFGLQTLFVLVFCIAVGMATNRGSWSSLQPAIATAMVIGLLQQARELRRWQLGVGSQRPNGRFAATYAVFWRIVVASAMAFFVVVNLGGWHEAVLYPDRDDLFFYEPATAIYDLLSIIVLASSIRRWKSSDDQVPTGSGRWLLFGLIAVAMTSFIVIDGRLTEYLVHKATAGLEASIPPRFQRPGVFPNHTSEGFRSFWLSFAAAISAAIGSTCLVLSSKQRSSTARKLCVSAFVTCLISQALYCRWFYSIEFHRITPDLAGAGLAAVPRDWLISAILLAVIATTIAYCMSASTQERAIVSTNLADNLEQTAFHETVLCLALMSLAAAIMLSMTMLQLVSGVFNPIVSSSHLNRWLQLWLNFGMLFNPTIVLILAQSCLVFQLCHIRWRRQRQEVRWELPTLSPRKFAMNWIALALAILVGVPTLGAFGFLFWLGPFNFSGF